MELFLIDFIFIFLRRKIRKTSCFFNSLDGSFYWVIFKFRFLVSPEAFSSRSETGPKRCQIPKWFGKTCSKFVCFAARSAHAKNTQFSSHGFCDIKCSREASRRPPGGALSGLSSTQIPFASNHYGSLWERSGSALFRDKDEKGALSERLTFSSLSRKSALPERSQSESKTQLTVNDSV